MKVYLAAPYPLREQMCNTADTLRAAGHTITSRWLLGDELTHQAAQMDLDDVYAADVLIAVNPVGWETIGTGGRHAEFGYALALGKKIILVGLRSNVFHYLESVIVVDSIYDAMKELQ